MRLCVTFSLLPVSKGRWCTLGLPQSVTQSAGHFASAGGSTLVQVFKVRMQDGAAARTDGVNIWVDDRLNEAEERCAIAHELEHIRRGEGTCQPEYVEMEVRYAVAQQLLPDLDTIPCEGDDLAEIARFWGVTRRVLMDRAVTLTSDQAMTAGCFSCLKCPSQAAKMREFVDGMVADRTHREHPRILARSVVAA